MKISYQRIMSFLGKRKKSDYLILFFIGILLILIVIPTERTGSTAESSKVYYEDNTDLEKRLKGVLEKMEGVGEVSVMITGDRSVEGVLVVTQGASSPGVCQKISEAVLALFDIEPHKIKIVKMVQKE